jgi:HAD superfamily hydrolase (TIGR01549 family)
MRPFDLLIFDLGSTLIYFEGEWPEVWARANAQLLQHLTAAGLELPGKDFLREFTARLESYYAERDSEFIEYTTAYILRTLLSEMGYPDYPKVQMRAALQAMYAISQSHWHPEEDLLPTLSTLRQKGYRMALISNASDDADVQTLVDKAGIRSFFEMILTSAAAGIRKPNPQILRIVLDQLEVPAGRATMIGDTLGADILGAQNAGLFSIWIDRRADTAANRAHAGLVRPDAVIHSLEELPALLDQLAESSRSV